jgi:hypothetical protein
MGAGILDLMGGLPFFPFRRTGGMRRAEGLPTLVIAWDREKASGGVRKVVAALRMTPGSCVG